ncbi:TetR/AcrR family transcriptional regulator C-terminal domain-containing protein [Nocardia sp. NPDC004573]
MLLRHPWATGLIGTRVNVGPAMLRYIDATVGCLREAGFSLPEADRAWNALDSHLYGFTLQELNFPLQPAEYSSAAQQFLPLIPAAEYPHMNALAQLVIDGKHSGIADRVRPGTDPGRPGTTAHRETGLTLSPPGTSPPDWRCPARCATPRTTRRAARA